MQGDRLIILGPNFASEFEFPAQRVFQIFKDLSCGLYLFSIKNFKSMIILPWLNLFLVSRPKTESWHLIGQNSPCWKAHVLNVKRKKDLRASIWLSRFYVLKQANVFINVHKAFFYKYLYFSSKSKGYKIYGFHKSRNPYKGHSQFTQRIFAVFWPQMLPTVMFWPLLYHQHTIPNLQ